MIKIFLITQQDNLNGKIVYADSEDEARCAAHNPIYVNEKLSECKQITIEIINSYSCNSAAKNLDAIMVKYKNKTYHLRKNVAEDVF